MYFRYWDIVSHPCYKHLILPVHSNAFGSLLLEKNVL